MDKSRVNLGSAAPAAYKAMNELDRIVSEFATAAGIAEGVAHLLRLRASQLNQCAFCVRMHARDALTSGETSDRVSVLAAWRETEYFTAKERAALALIEAVTLIAKDQVPDAIYAEAAAALTNEEIAAVEWIGVAINSWNRIAIAGRSLVKP